MPSIVLGLVLTRTGRARQAEAPLLKAVDFYRALPRNRGIEKAEALTALAECELQLHRTERAEELRKEAAAFAGL